MWGCTNSRLVLRRGICSVVKSSRHGRTGYASSPELSVTSLEFRKALEGVFPRPRWRERATVGLAISGGVDSMALATLYAELRRQLKGSLPVPHGIIIDHKVRKESTEEAEWVAEQLRQKLNIDSTIVELTWPKELDLDDLQRFETEARRLRYQALGIACRDRHINSLLVAHHGDDQAETIMMRLIKGRLRSGLQGMHGVEWIPECHGMHGVYHSGDLLESLLLASRSNQPHLQTPTPFPVEKGGIRVLRPLLGFEKSRLVATCEGYGTPWAEDHTNAIPTLTTRNAVRHIVHKHTLPTALSKSSLISLADRMQQRVQSHRTAAETLFNKTPFSMDLATGSLIVRFPLASDFLSVASRKGKGEGKGKGVTQFERNWARNTAFLYLTRVADLISPREDASIGQFSYAIDHIWPSLSSESEAPSTTSTTSTSPSTNAQASPAPASASAPKTNGFCVFGVWFRPLVLKNRENTALLPHLRVSSNSNSRKEKEKDTMKGKGKGKAKTKDMEEKKKEREEKENMIYHLSRQPLDQVEKRNPESRLCISSSPPPSTKTTTSSSSSSSSGSPALSEWHLFDGRYWLRLTPTSSSSSSTTPKTAFTIRTLTPADLEALSTAFPPKTKNPQRLKPKNDKQRLYQQLTALKPAGLRFVVPAVFAARRDGAGEEDGDGEGEGELIALPTLAPGMSNMGLGMGMETGKEVCKIEVRYKKIDIGTHKAADVFVRGKATRAFYECARGGLVKAAAAAAAAAVQGK